MIAIFRQWTAATLCLMASTGSFAANGLYTTGVGAVSSAMSGADIALSRDTSAVITNAAGLSQIRGSQTDVYASVFYGPNTGHDDGFTDKRVISNDLGAIVGLGYAHFLENYDVTVATGINFAGGFGYVYDDIGTAFGTVDDTHALFSLIRSSLAAGWQVSDKLSLGLSVGLTYAAVEQSLFPNTSVFNVESGTGFFGVEVEKLEGWGGDLKLGAQYQLSPRLRLGLIYGTTTNLPLNGDKLTVNYEALDLGRVDYKDVELDGLKLPQELGVGLAWQMSDDLLISTEIAWYDWGSSIDTFVIEARNPESTVPQGADILSFASPLNLRSRGTYSIGFEKVVSQRLTLRMGYAYAPMIIPKDNLTPTFALVAEEDISIGLGLKLDNKRTFHTGVSLQPYRKVRYNNSSQPFGPSEETNEVILLHLMLTLG